MHYARGGDFQKCSCGFAQASSSEMTIIVFHSTSVFTSLIGRVLSSCLQRSLCVVVFIQRLELLFYLLHKHDFIFRVMAKEAFGYNYSSCKPWCGHGLIE